MFQDNMVPPVSLRGMRLEQLNYFLLQREITFNRIVNTTEANIELVSGK